jgi:hypothetical protein
MSEHEFENYLTLISRFLRLSPAQREAIGEELRDHFESRLAELVDRGHSHAEAVRLALEEFGDAAGLAANFSSITQTRRRRLIMRCTVASVAALAAAVVVAMAVWPENHAGRIVGNAVADTKEQRPDATEKNQTLRAAQPKSEVDAKLDGYTALEFQDVPLKVVLEYIHDKHQIDIYTKMAKLRDQGIDPAQVPVTFNLHHVRTRLALDVILQESGLAYYVDDGIVFVTTSEDVKQKLVTRIYDCRKILAADATENRPWEAPSGPEPKSDHDMAPAKSSAKHSIHDTPVEKLIGVVTSIVDSPSWSEAGGPGTIGEYNGLLIVSNTPAAHDQIGKLLDELAQYSASKEKHEDKSFIDRR